MQNKSANFLVVGAGVVGLNLALQLKNRFSDSCVRMLEKEAKPGLRASGRNSGVLHALKILDFGGGLAPSFFSVVSSLHSVDRLEFHVVEGKAVCDKANDIFPQNTGLYFHDEIPKDCEGFDVIHAGSSLQHIDDWRGLLASFTRLKPRYLILADVLAGNIKSFVALQNYYGYKIRSHFLNFQKLIDEAEKLGFQLLFKLNSQ